MDDLERELSGIMFTLFLVGTLTFTFNIQPGKAWTGTVYIRADGSIDPSDAPITTCDYVNYNFTDNVFTDAYGVVVERNNIVIDGKGCTLQGSGSGCGFYLSGRNNVTIKNTNITSFIYGVYLYSGVNCTICGNNVTNSEAGIGLWYSENVNVSDDVVSSNTWGIFLGESNNNTLSRNVVSSNNRFGIYIRRSYGETLSNNNMSNNRYNLFVVAPVPYTLSGFKNDIDASNTINGKPVYYMTNQKNLTIDPSTFPNIGYLALINSTNITVKNINLTNCGQGVLFAYTTDSTILNVSISNSCNGLDLRFSGDNAIINNTVTNSEYGILLHKSNGTIVSGNVVSSNVYNGIELWPSSNNTVIGNNVTLNDNGIVLKEGAERNKIVGNLLSDNNIGINLTRSSSNAVTNNTLKGTGVESSFGIGLELSSNNELVDNHIWSYDIGVDLHDSCNNTVIENSITANHKPGVFLHENSNNNTVSRNNITANNWYGIWLAASSNYNSISENNIANNLYGIELDSSSNNSISGNNITANNYRGIYLLCSSNNSISGNDITANNNYGIRIFLYSSNNTIAENSITNNGYGVWLYSSSDNRFCHNNFIDNTNQVYSYESKNVWDDGYPSGGNYWSDYKNRYPEAEELNGSGLWDTPYVTDEYNIDHYPLMYPYGTPNLQLTITATIGGTTDPPPGNYTYLNGTTISVTAIPEKNYVFAHWILDGINVGSQNPIDVLMTSNHTLHAVFLQLFELTIIANVGGTTDPPPGTYNHTNGTTVDVTAVPDIGYSFDYWLLDGELKTENPITILMDSNHTLEAYFIDDIKPDISDPWQDPPSNNVQPFQNVTVWVNVTDYGSRIKNATLWYSTNNGTTWTILNMTALPIPSDTTITYEATIPGYENCTWITYKIIAYDKAGNNQTKDNNGYGYKYHVIPEFPSAIILPLFMVISVIAVVFAKKTRYKKPKHSQSSPSFLRYSVSQSKM